MASEVEISAQITGVQSVLSEIEQLREAISNLTTGGAGGMGNVGNSYNAMQPQGDSPQQATAPHPNSGRPRYNAPTIEPAPPASAGRSDGGTDPYESYSHGGYQYTRFRGNHATAQSFLGYATAPLSDMGSLAHLGNGIQQMTSAFIDAHRLHMEHKRVSEEIASHLKEIKAQAQGVTSGGVVTTPDGVGAVSPGAGGMGANIMGMIGKASPWVAAAYGIYAGVRGVSQLSDDFSNYGAGGYREQAISRSAELQYMQNYGYTDRYGFGEGGSVKRYYLDLQELNERTQRESMRWENPLASGMGMGMQMMKTMQPGLYAERRQQAMDELAREMADREAKQLRETLPDLYLRGLGYNLTAGEMDSSIMPGNGSYYAMSKRFAGRDFRALGVEVAERLGRTGLNDLTGLGMDDLDLEKFGLDQKTGKSTMAEALLFMYQNTQRYGGMGSLKQFSGSGFQGNRGMTLDSIARAMVLEDNPAADSVGNLARALGGKFSEGSQAELRNILNEGGNLASTEVSRLGSMTAEQMSLQMLGGSREQIYSNMKGMEGLYEAQVTDARIRLQQTELTGDPKRIAEARTRLTNVLRQRDMASQAPLNYGYQTTEFRNTLTGATAEGEMGVMLNMGASIYDLAGNQSIAEESIRGNIANLERKIRDPRLAVNAEQRRQWYIEKLNLEKRLQGSRRGYMDTAFGEDMSRVGVSGALAGSEVAFAEMFGGAGARLEAEEGSLEAQGAAVGLLRGRYNDMASGRRPSTQKEINETLSQLIEAMSKLTMATERSAQNRFDIPIAIAGQRGAIASTYMSLGISAGAGGMGIAGDFSEGYSEASQEVAGWDAKVADLRARGHDENSGDLLRAKQAAGQARLKQLSLGSSFAGSPLSASSQNAINQSQFELGILNTLPGAVGSRRNVIGSQINLLSGAVEETMARMDFQRQAQGGVLTNADQLRYNDELRGYKTQQVGLFNEMSYGWQSRLMSTIINAPGNFAGVAPGLAMRAAVGSGVRNPLFGSNGFDIPDFMGGASLMGSISGATGTPVGMAVTGMTRTPGASPATPLYVVNVGGQGNMGTRGVDPYRPGENVKMPTPKHLTDTPH